MANCPGRAEFSPLAWAKSDNSVRGELSGSPGASPLSEAVAVLELDGAPFPGPDRTGSSVDRTGLPGAEGPSSPGSRSSAVVVPPLGGRRVAP